ncbi:hypothetical protein IFM89_000108 [Coptis chinensis]|uniref:Uncharacterized protein n=1 Tax=Coptis chinensis TaxID=261450 RepID=A0A835HZS4_9MAGN|nr:hypothetical protein IFM89_000108 [Coptis chinensis]
MYETSCMNKQPYGNQVWFKKKMTSNLDSLRMSRVSRRIVIKFMGLSSVLLRVGVSLGAPSPMVEKKEPPVLRTLKLPSGVLIEGEGPEAQDGGLVEVNYVCRRSNGYFIHSTVDQFSGESTPVKLPLADNQVCLLSIIISSEL